MQSFFDNPDAATVNDNAFSLNWQGTEQKGIGGEFGGQLDGLDNESQMIHNPAMTIGGSSSSSYNTHSTSDHHHLPSNSRTGFLGNSHQHEQASDDDDVKAASGLYNMFMNSQDGSRGTAIFGASTGGSWGNFGSSHPVMPVQEHLRSPLPCSGRQSANSYHSVPHHSAHANQQFQSEQSQPQSQMLHPYLWQQQQMANVPRARHSSLQIDTSNFNFFPQQPTQTQMPQSALLPGQSQSTSRPTVVRFGSDQDFRSYGYRAPSGHIPPEYEKAANLNNVPFAAQAAANGQSHVETLTPVGLPRSYQHYGMPTSTSAIHSASTNSSPNNFGGLPMPSMTPSSYRHSHPFHQMARQATDDDDDIDSDQDVEFEDSKQPRKRRKSQMQLDDDAEYSPSHVKVPVPKRGPKAAKAHGVDGSDDDYEEVTPSTNKTSIKRRKSSTNARPSLGSSQSGSPSAMASPTGKATSSSKKKHRASQSRQNLTEDEKRRNHIQSEKTRRDLIKLQYDSLDSLVPALKLGKSGLSRSDVLKEIVAYVESVVDGNKKMEKSLGSDVLASGAGGGGFG